MSNSSLSSSEQGNSSDQKGSNMSEIVTKLIEKLVSKDVAVTYTFDHLQIDVPQARGPGGKELGGAKWIIDGKLVIASTSTSSHKDQQSPSTDANSNTSTISDSSKYIAA
ncbi:MAG: hypothetical protein H0X50_09700 [Nitrosopumilus sp.]|nr:hypothetical protein [Nitrosopumilus sp.]